MVLQHIGINAGNEEDALRFYSGVLGFENTREFLLSPELANQLFKVSREVKVLVFNRDGIILETFICPECVVPFPDFRHIGLYLPDLDAVLAQARAKGAGVIVGRTAEKTVYFLKDFSGNLVEIKQG